VQFNQPELGTMKDTTMKTNTVEYIAEIDSQMFFDDYVCMYFENEQVLLDDYRFVNDLKHRLHGFEYVILYEHLVFPTVTSNSFVVCMPLDHVVERSQTLEIAKRLSENLRLEHCHTIHGRDEDDYQEYINSDVPFVVGGTGRMIPVQDFLEDAS
jgi:hypothetical protein